MLARRHVRDLVNVAPGDFAAVFRQHRFCPVRDADDFVWRLAKELAFKRESGGRAIRFGGGA